MFHFLNPSPLYAIFHWVRGGRGAGGEGFPKMQAPISGEPGVGFIFPKKRRHIMNRLIVLMFSVVFLFGCNHYSTANAKNLNPSLSYRELSDKLTVHYDHDLGWWRDIKTSVTLLHPLMRSYRKGIPETGTSFEFSIAGIEEGFIVDRVIFIIEKDDGKKLIISGLNTDKFLVKNEHGEEVRDGVEFVSLQQTGGPQHDVINRFLLTVPIDITNAKWITIDADNTDGTFEDRHFKFKWLF